MVGTAIKTVKTPRVTWSTKTLQVQLGHQVNRGARPQSTTEHIDDAMDVVQGQKQGDDIRGLPLPGVDQGADLGSDAAMGW